MVPQEDCRCGRKEAITFAIAIACLTGHVGILGWPHPLPRNDQEENMSDSEPASDSDPELSSASDSQESDADEINEVSVHEPAGRRGACSFVHLEQVYLFQGYEGGAALDQRPQGSLAVLDPQAGRWSSVSTSGEVLPESISGACCAVMNDCLYTFGGWIAGFRNADVHELDLESLVWRKLKPDNPGKGPFLKDKAGMVPYGEEMLCVFAEYGYPSENHITQGGYRGQTGASYKSDPDSFHGICWTNELHLFHVKRCKPYGNWRAWSHMIT